MILILLFFSFSLSAMEVAVISYKALTHTDLVLPSVSVNPAITVDASKNVLVGAIAALRKYMVSVPQSDYAYGIETGIGKDYDALKTWIEWQLTGQMDKLVDKKAECLAKGTKLGGREAATIGHMLNARLTNRLHIIAKGTREEAKALMDKMNQERMANEMYKNLYGHAVPEQMTFIEYDQAQALYAQRFNPEHYDMTQSYALEPRNIHKEVCQEVLAGIHRDKYKSFDAYMAAIGERLETLKHSDLYKRRFSTTPLGTTETIDETLRFVRYIGNGIYTELALEEYVEALTFGVATLNDLTNPFEIAKAVREILHSDDTIYAKYDRLMKNDPTAISDYISSIVITVAKTPLDMAFKPIKKGGKVIKITKVHYKRIQEAMKKNE